MGRFWKSKSVLVTGGSGFIGSFVVENLLEEGANITVITHTNKLENLEKVKKEIKIVKADLLDFPSIVKATKKQDVIMHLAAKVAGIQFNISHPATMFGDNVVMAKNILDAALKNSTERVLLTSSACVYPRNCTIPTPENEGFNDDPEPTNLGYGWAKRTIEIMGRLYNLEYGLKTAIARPYNTYGPRDNFDPSKSHVIPGIIKRLDSGENPLTIWGSGKQTRSFIYVKDLAKGLIKVTEKYAITDPINIGSSEEISIKELAQKIVSYYKKGVEIQFDTSKPDGQPRRSCDVTKLEKEIGFKQGYSIDKGLQETIQWYEQHS